MFKVLPQYLPVETEKIHYESQSIHIHYTLRFEHEFFRIRRRNARHNTATFVQREFSEILLYAISLWVVVCVRFHSFPIMSFSLKRVDLPH